MLASTVQFSNNDQPPVTHHLRDASPGPATEESPFPQIPNSVPDTLASPSRVPRRSSTSDQSRSSVPSSQRSTHEQPASDVR
jgi:ABC-type dipeptide/oligopeptide/nickel transport system ATPase component